MSDLRESLFKEQAKVTDVDWEYIIVGIQSLDNLPKEFLGKNNPDPYVHVEVVAKQPKGIAFDKPTTQFRFPTRKNQERPIWHRLGMVAYVKGTAKLIKFTVKDANLLKDKTLLEVKVAVPEKIGQWKKDILIKGENNVTLVVRMKRDVEPIQCSADLEGMGLSEKIFTLSSGQKSSLVYKRNSSFRQAVMYFPGYRDSFRHPHVLEMFTSLGFDFYSIDCHGCGRCVRFLEDPQYGHDVKDMDDYIEDIEEALNFLKMKQYDNSLVFCHSTGALVFMNYYMKRREEFFSGVIFNGPFLDWGHVGGDLMEFVLENIGVLGNVTGKEFILQNGGKKVSKWQAMRWILYRHSLVQKPIISGHLTSDFATAATRVQRKVMRAREGVFPTEIPGLVLSSEGDDTLDHEETVERSTKVFGGGASIVQLEQNSHDVCLSNTKELNDNALEVIWDWIHSRIIEIEC